jgi:hypothetical protein
MVAQIVNAVGNSSYWSETAIFITWDDWAVGMTMFLRRWYSIEFPRVCQRMGGQSIGLFRLRAASECFSSYCCASGCGTLCQRPASARRSR